MTDAETYTTRKKSKRIDKYRNLIQADEPVIDQEKPIDRWDLIRICSWYNERYVGEEGRAWLVDYCEKYLPEYVTKAKEGKLYYIQPCVYARCALRGGILPKETEFWLKKFIQNMEIAVVKVNNDRVQLAQAAKKARTEERADQFEEFLSAYEYDYDNLIKGGKSQLDVLKQLQTFNPTGVRVREFVKTLKLRLKDIKDSLKRGNDDLKEGYSKYPRMRIRAFETHYTTTIEQCERYIAGGTTKKPRKARAKKYVPVERAIAKVQLGAGTIFGLKTFTPENVLDASAVVVYNNKYNQLSLLVAEKKLSIKGTTIQGISEKDSIRKRIKKPQEVLTQVSKAINTNAITNIFSKVKNASSAVTGRLNEDTYIIKVFK